MPVLIRILSVLLLSTVAASALADGRSTDVVGTQPLPLEPMLAGEFALQAGELDDATRWYLQAAEAESGDVGLAERATRIAMLANDDEQAKRALKLWKARAPDSMAMRSSSASLALRSGHLRKARRELLSLMRESDSKGWKFALVALAGGGSRNPDGAAKVLSALVDADAIPDQIEAWQEFGRLALRMEQPKLARRMIGEVVEKFPGDPRVALLHATQLNQAGKRDEALAVLHGLEPKAVSDTDLRGALALAYDAMDDSAAAARILAVGPQDTPTYGLRASMLAKEEDVAGLTALYDELKASSADPAPARRLLIGKIAEYLKRYQEAVDWYQGVSDGPLRGEAELRAASALYELGNKREAFDQVHALQADAAAEDDDRRDAYLLEADLRQQDGDDAGELEVFERGLAAYPDDSELLYARGLAWERRDNIERAEADLRRILAAEPENVAALNALGYTLADRTTRYKEALALIERARVAEPDNPAIVDSYGWVLYRLGRNKEALVQLRRAWTLAKDPEIGAHLAELLWLAGQHDEARAVLEQARALDPENRAVQRASEKMSP